MFVEAVFKQADEGVGVQFDVAAGEAGSEGGLFEVARQFELCFADDVVEHGYAAKAAFEGEGGGRLNFQRAVVAAPRGDEAGDGEFVAAAVVGVSGVDAGDEDGAGFAAADAADGEFVNLHGQRQVYAFGQFGGRAVFRRRGFALDVDVARVYLFDVQEAV